jgi:glycosyltransferase involved in cell wall biosynthesis
MTTPTARIIHLTRSCPNGEFIGYATFPRQKTRAMKIIVLQDRLRSGGTERHSILLGREFAQMGHQAELVTFRPGGKLAPSVTGPHRSLQPFDTGIDWFAPGLLRTVLGASPDIVLCMGKTANCFAGRIQRHGTRRRLPTQVVATLRAGGVLPRLYYSSVKSAAHLVTNSREAADILVSRHSLERAKTSVIHNSLVFPEASQGRDRELRARLGAGPSTSVLLSVGMFRPEKNQRALIEIAAGFPADWDWRLWMAGEGPEKAACERRAADLGLSGRVHFLGYQADPSPYYKAADIAVHASKEEALSNFLIEAQSHGLPAVASRALGIEECFVPGRTGWMLEQGDADGFRAALARLRSDSPEEREARAAEARAFARTSFDPKRQVAAYLTLFEKLLGGTASTPAP